MMELNRIYNVDCFDAMQELEDCSIDAVITDPPYCVGISSNGVKSTFTDMSIIKPFYRELYRECARLLKPNGFCYVFTDWRTYPLIAEVVPRYMKHRNMIVWDKASLTASSWYMFSHELIVFSVNGKGTRKFRTNHHDVIRVPRVPEVHRIHLAQKPQALIMQLIEDSTDPGELILDPFSGSGTTAVCCRELDRNFIAFELDEKYYADSVKRLESRDLNIRLKY